MSNFVVQMGPSLGKVLYNVNTMTSRAKLIEKKNLKKKQVVIINNLDARMSLIYCYSDREILRVSTHCSQWAIISTL